MSTHNDITEFSLLISPMFAELAEQCDTSITRVAMAFKQVQGQMTTVAGLRELGGITLALLPHYANELPLMDVVTPEAMEHRATAFDSAIISTKATAGYNIEQDELVFVDPEDANIIVWMRHLSNCSVVTVGTLAQYMAVVELLLASEGRGTIKLH